MTLVQVASQVSGMISKLYVDFNSEVTQGQVIAEIDPKLFQGAVLQAQADLQNAEALLAAAKANLAKDEATQKQNKLDYDRAGCASPKSRMSRLRFPVTTFKGWDWPESVASHGFRPGLLAVSRAESQCTRRYSWP